MLDATEALRHGRPQKPGEESTVEEWRKRRALKINIMVKSHFFNINSIEIKFHGFRARTLGRAI